MKEIYDIQQEQKNWSEFRQEISDLQKERGYLPIPANIELMKSFNHALNEETKYIRLDTQRLKYELNKL